MFIEDFRSNEKSFWSVISHMSQAYYSGSPIVSDARFDELYDDFKARYPRSKYLRQPAKGFNVNESDLQKFQHKYEKVGSLEKIHAMSEFTNYGEDSNYSISSKLDGSTMVLYYVNGEFERALTRGDGATGLDVSSKAVLICDNLKDKLSIHNIPFTGAIRGEVVMSKDNFNKYKELHPEAKMARNVSTGVLNRKDNFEEDCQYINFVTYKILADESVDDGAYTIGEIRDQLAVWGFEVVSNISCNMRLVTDERLAEIYALESFSKYPTDGLVFTKNICYINSSTSIEYDEIAYKFKAESKDATVTNVSWELSRTGKMIPVVNIEPVELSGAIVKNVSGFNYKFINDNKIGPGAIINVLRSGEVIPYIDHIVKESDNMIIPKVCPICGEPLNVTETGVSLICNNPECNGTKYMNAYRFIEIMCRDIKGIGPAIIEHILDKVLDNYGNLNEYIVYLFFTETRLEDILEGEKPMMIKLLTSVYGVMNNLWDKQTFLEALNIPGVGKTIAADIVNSKLFDELYEDYAKSYNKIDKINTSSLIYSKLTEVVANNLICNLSRIFNFSFNKFAITNVIEKFVAITGSLSISRKEFEKFLADNGYGITDNIKKAECLITNDPNSGSSKNKKAKELGVRVMTEEEFRGLL